MTESDAIEFAAKDVQEASLAMGRIKGPDDVTKLFTRFFVHRINSTGDGDGREEAIQTMERRIDSRSVSTDIVSRVIATLEMLRGILEPEDTLAIMTWLDGPMGAPAGFTHAFLGPVQDSYTEAALSELDDWVSKARLGIEQQNRHIFGVLAKELTEAERGVVASELRDADIALNDKIRDGQTWRHRRIVARGMVHAFLRRRQG